jgi:hypothetical protein
MFVPHDRAFRRVQLSIRYGHRIYDRSMAGLGTAKAQRYFAFDLDPPSDRLFDDAIEVERRHHKSGTTVTRLQSVTMTWRRSVPRNARGA